MQYRPRKDMHFSRRALGWLFLACGLLLLSVHYLAGLPFLAFAAVFLYYAPRWDLRIEVGPSTLRFSENLVDTGPVEIQLEDLAEIRRITEDSGRRNLLTGSPDYMGFLEFVTRSGKVWRMHDVFSDDLDKALGEAAAKVGAEVKDLEN